MGRRHVYQLEDLGSRYEVRLSALREWHVIRIRCFNCERVGDVYPKTLRRQFPADTRLIDLQPKFRCRRCGNSELNLWKIYRLPRDP